MAKFEVTTPVRDWLKRRRKDELIHIILGNLSRIDLFADEPHQDKRELPLKVEVKDDHLCFAIGIDTLAFAFENGEFAGEFKVGDQAQFAQDVCDELNREGEDGSTPLTRLLDQMMSEAAEQGSLGLKEAADA